MNTTVSIYFTPNGAELTLHDKNMLDNCLGKIEKEINNHLIQIMGYSDSKGNFFRNLELSKLRTLVIKDYLLSAGIKNERIMCFYFGEYDGEGALYRKADVMIIEE